MLSASLASPASRADFKQEISKPKYFPNGLVRIDNFVTEDEERDLMAWVDAQPWAGHGIE
jgi:hypothetical protein